MRQHASLLLYCIKLVSDIGAHENQLRNCGIEPQSMVDIQSIMRKFGYSQRYHSWGMQRLVDLLLTWRYHSHDPIWRVSLRAHNICEGTIRHFAGDALALLAISLALICTRDGISAARLPTLEEITESSLIAGGPAIDPDDGQSSSSSSSA